MTHPATTLALALRDGGFAKTPMPQIPAALAPFLELRQVALPPLAAGQVSIRVTAAPVNPSDLFFVQGSYGQPRVQGQAAGFEGTGTVIAGNGAQAEKLIGRRVSFLGTGTGAWAQHAISDAALCIPLRDDVLDADGAAMIVNPLTAVALIDRVRQAGGKSFVVNAAGSQLGRLMLGLARDEGLQATGSGRGVHEIALSGRPFFLERIRHKMRILGVGNGWAGGHVARESFAK